MFDMTCVLLPFLVLLKQENVRFVQIGMTIILRRLEQNFGMEFWACFSVRGHITYVREGARLLCVWCTAMWGLRDNLLTPKVHLGEASVYYRDVFLRGSIEV